MVHADKASPNASPSPAGAHQEAVQLIECPRDAMQGWGRFIATGKKIEYINALLQAGFHTIDFGSFVSPKAIPQLADTKEVVAGLDLKNTKTKLLAIVANRRGAEEAVAYDAISCLGFPFSLSETFQRRNANSSLEESVTRVEEIQNLCSQKGKQLVIYLSMGFGNPYGDAYNEDILLHWSGEMVAREIHTISLADTVGVATPEQIRIAVNFLLARYPQTAIGVHLHAAPTQWKAKLQAAVEAGCKRYDGALKGIGGCPMAGNELVGNMDTEKMIPYLEEEGGLEGINREALQKSLFLASKLFV